jgi:hypothetical protein
VAVTARVYFVGGVHAWLRLQVARYWTTPGRNPAWDLDYLDTFLRFP